MDEEKQEPEESQEQEASDELEDDPIFEVHRFATGSGVGMEVERPAFAEGVLAEKLGEAGEFLEKGDIESALTEILAYLVLRQSVERGDKQDYYGKLGLVDEKTGQPIGTRRFQITEAKSLADAYAMAPAAGQSEADRINAENIAKAEAAGRRIALPGDAGVGFNQLLSEKAQRRGGNGPKRRRGRGG